MMHVGGAPLTTPALFGRQSSGKGELGGMEGALSPHCRQRAAGGTPKGRSLNGLSLPETQKDDKP